MKFGDFTILIKQITEHDAIGWAALCTCRHNSAIFNFDSWVICFISIREFHPSVLRRNLNALNSLRAECAFLHHATEAHADIRVSLELCCGAVDFVVSLRVIEEIEPPNFVGTVVGAITGADAPVVGHVV